MPVAEGNPRLRELKEHYFNVNFIISKRVAEGNPRLRELKASCEIAIFIWKIEQSQKEIPD